MSCMRNVGSKLFTVRYVSPNPHSNWKLQSKHRCDVCRKVKGKVEASKGMGGMDLSLYVPTADGFVRAQDKWTREPVGVSVPRFVPFPDSLLWVLFFSASDRSCSVILDAANALPVSKPPI